MPTDHPKTPTLPTLPAMTTTNRQFVLDQLPKAALQASDFRLNTTTIPQPAPGQVLLRTRIVSLDAANRAWMQGATYRSALEAGQVMAGGALAEVAEVSAAPGTALKVGDLVWAHTGWQEWAALPAEGLNALPPLPDGQPLTPGSASTAWPASPPMWA
jgi:hypothetical protein